jgi:hypothetical protein
MRHLTDEARFEPSPEGGLVVTLVKYVNEE